MNIDIYGVTASDGIQLCTTHVDPKEFALPLGKSTPNLHQRTNLPYILDSSTLASLPIYSTYIPCAAPGLTSTDGP